MHRMVGQLVLLLSAASPEGSAPDAGADPRVVEAQAALGEASQLRAQARFGDAVSRAERARSLLEAALGEGHPQVAACLDLLGMLWANQGEYRRAEPLLVRALAIREAALGEDGVEVADSLISLAALYAAEGLDLRVEPLLLRSLAIREGVLGRDHPKVASSLNSLGVFHLTAGEYARAEPLFQQALRIVEKALGADHLHYAYSLNNLAVLYKARGLHGRAEALWLRSLEIEEATLGKDHPAVARLLGNLASLYVAQEQYARAEPLLLRALSIRERTLSPDDPDIANAAIPLAKLYVARGEYGRAEPLLLRALRNAERALSADNIVIPTVLDHLAECYQAQGRHRLAEPLRRRSLRIRAAAQGELGPELAISLSELGTLRAARGDLAEAVPLLASAFDVSERHLRREGLVLSGAQLDDFLRLLRSRDDRLYSLLRRHPDDAGVRRLALATALLRKGRSTEETANLSRAIARDLTSGDREAFERLRALRAQLASARTRERARELAERGDALEADLARHSAPLRALRALPEARDVAEDVRKALPAGGVLVELVEYEDRPIAPTPGTPPSKVPRRSRYLALLLSTDGRTRAVDLGPASAIDAAVSRLDRAMASASAPYLGACQALYALAVRPWLSLTGDAGRIYLAPDGKLGLVPFGALHDGRSFLADSRDVVYLTSGRDLLPHPDEVASGQGVVVFADPDFGGAPAAAGSVRSVEPSPQCVDMARVSWSPLPGARREAAAVKRLFPEAQLRVGPEATKAALFELQGPKVLHIATHGISGDLRVRRQPDARVPAAIDPLSAPAGECPQDPLLRSGIVLARPPAPGERPGSPVATALELMGLDLWGTELVVLSGCGTGRGVVERSQGVYGLRRAFLVAGAETLVTSLWPIDDGTTAVLMEEYYRRLGSGAGRVAALRQAMLAVRARKPHPHYWAPFIAIGRDGPLSGNSGE